MPKTVEHNVTLDGGVCQQEDGSWSVMCVFAGIATPDDAQRLSEWLQHLVTNHLFEVSRPVDRREMH